MSFNVPVLFITFNRLDTTCQVFEAIRAQKPQTLYLFSDGPRADKPQEQQEVQAVRAWLTSRVDWPCTLHVRFLDENMGPRYAIGHAVNWLFEQEEEGIVFEHDCLPHADFFRYCQYLLDKYRHDERVMHITGNNFLFGRVKVPADYYFSNLSNPTWGWATWKRAWKCYDAEMASFPQFLEENGFDRFIRSKRVRTYYEEVFGRLYRGEIRTWDYQWSLAIWQRKGLTVTPAVNLVSNIGYGDKAIHTADVNDQFAFIPTMPLTIQFSPSFVEAYNEADSFVLEQVIRPPFLKRVRILKKMFKMRPLSYD
jgi:hypothetical protein